MSEAFAGFVARRLAGLQRLHPQLRVHILVANRAHDVARGEADVALRLMDKPDNPDLRIRKLGELGWSLYAARGYLLDAPPIDGVESLQNHSLVGFEDTMSRADGAVWLRENGLSSHVVLHTNSIPSAFNAAISGLGIAPPPCFLGEDEPHLVRVMDLVIARRSLFMVCHPDIARAARVRAVIDYLVGLLGRERSLLEGPVDDNADRPHSEIG